MGKKQTKKKTLFYFELNITGYIKAGSEQEAKSILFDTTPRNLEGVDGAKEIVKDVYLDDDTDEDDDE